MNDDELTRRLSETLRAKADQVPEQTEAFDASARVTELDPRSTKPARGAWRYALASAALIALVAGIIAAVVAVTSDDRPDVAGPGPNTTIEAPSTLAPSTTAPTSTTTLPAATTTTPTPTTAPPPPPWSEHPQQLPDGTVPVANFNAYLDAHPSAATDPRQLALTFTQLDPPPTEPANAVTVEEQARPNGRHQAVVFERLADDSVAQLRFELLFAPHNDGTWRLESASWSQRCQPNRGHQEFSTALCV